MSDYHIAGQKISPERPSPWAQHLPRGASCLEDVEQSVPDRFEKVVSLHSNRLAIKTAKHALTYDALNKAANRVACVVLEKSRNSDTPLVVVFDHDAPIVVAILAVLKAGKTCVVLDPSYPEQRAAHIIEDSQATLILTNSKNLPLAHKFAQPGHQLFNIDEIDLNVPAENLGLCISPDAFAFILYTSGSTGQPKGVIQNHRNVIHNALRYASGCRIGPQDRVTLLASLGTGQGTPTAFSALLSGAALYPLHVKQEGVADLGRWLRTEEITIYISTPSLFRSLVGTLTGQEEFPKLRTIRLGAEQIRKSDIELYKKYFSEKCLLALFLSATEAGNLCQYFVDKATEIPGDTVPAGRPVDGIDILLLDDSGKEVGLNEIGEIVVKSRFISPGYWRNPELTKAVFLPDGDKRLYHTGDLGRLLANGELEHLGRKDFQIKIRGYRVEVAEIESALLQLDQVKEAIVVAVKSGNGDAELAAYVVPNGRPAPGASEFRRLLKEKLPDYMIPASFVMLEAFPLNPTGKVDRQALPPPTKDISERNGDFVPPDQTVEHQLVQIWEEFLGVHPIGLRDSFFDLGGHSLLAAQMMHRVEQVCGQKLPLATLLAGPTIEHLAQALIEQRVKENDSLLVQVQAGGAKQPLFFMHGDLAGGGFYCLNLARGLGEDQPFYALTPHGVDGGPIPSSIEEIATSFIQMIRAVQPEGPYLLGGLCKGGVTAYEMARQLERQGEKVDLLIIVGSTGWNTHFRLLNVLVSAIGFFFRLTPGERARLFLASREFCLYLPGRLREVAKFSAGQKVSWAWRVVKKAARRVTQITAIDRQRLVVDSIGAQYSKPLSQSLREFYLSSPYGTQLGGYVPGRYSGRVELFWANDEQARHPLTPTLLWNQMADRSLGWGRVAKQLRVHILPGVTNTSITTDVKLLAEQMKACLEEVQASKRGRSPFRPDSKALFSKGATNFN
jgi:amino acid adenylation domain-containing protein